MTAVIRLYITLRYSSKACVQYESRYIKSLDYVRLDKSGDNMCVVVFLKCLKINDLFGAYKGSSKTSCCRATPSEATRRRDVAEGAWPRRGRRGGGSNRRVTCDDSHLISVRIL